MIWLGWTSNCWASSASVFSPLTAARATFALKAGVWFRRGRLLIVSPALRPSWPPSGRDSTYPTCSKIPSQLSLLWRAGTGSPRAFCSGGGVNFSSRPPPPSARPRRPLSRWRYLLPLSHHTHHRPAAVWLRSSGPGDGCGLRVPLIGTPSWRSSASWSGADDPGSDRRAGVAGHGPHGHAQRLRWLGAARAGDAPA